MRDLGEEEPEDLHSGVGIDARRVELVVVAVEVVDELRGRLCDFRKVRLLLRLFSFLLL